MPDEFAEMWDLESPPPPTISQRMLRGEDSQGCWIQGQIRGQWAADQLDARAHALFWPAISRIQRAEVQLLSGPDDAVAKLEDVQGHGLRIGVRRPTAGEPAEYLVAYVVRYEA